MKNLENIKEIQQLLSEAYQKLLNVQIKDEENIEAQKEILSDINEVYKKLRTNFNTSIWGELTEGDNEMKNKLSVNNLMNTYYDNEMYELEFHTDGKKVIITKILEKDHPDAYEDQWYFENEETLKEIIMNAEDNDIKEVK